MEALQNYLFIDIETAPLTRQLDDLSLPLQKLWMEKAIKKNYVGDEPAESPLIFQEKAAIFSEFGRIVCISIGCFRQGNGSLEFNVKSIAGADEHELLLQFCKAMDSFSRRIPRFIFCGHNIREFDIPFISRRMIINRIALPKYLEHHGKKPWEVTHADTMQLWSFGDRKNYTSLALLATVLGIPTPKDDINGADVGRVFWEENDLPRICRYCEKDVVTTAKVFIRLMGYEEVSFEVRHLSEES